MLALLDCGIRLTLTMDSCCCSDGNDDDDDDEEKGMKSRFSSTGPIILS